MRTERTNVAKADILLPQLAEKLPETTHLNLNAVYPIKYAKKNPFEIAQALERLYWQDIECGFENHVFNNYLLAGAYKSARRFFVQTRPYVLDPIAVSNGRGSVAFVMGYVLDDPELRRVALEASRSGSASDMSMHIWEAAIRDNAADLKANTQELIDRYETRSGASSRGRRLMGFLPLLPALKDPKHADRSEALNYFGDSAQWLVLRWIWINKYKLSKDDAIRFLGGRETDPFRHVLICYLESDAAAAKEALKGYADPDKRFSEQTFLAYYLAHSLQKKPFDKPEPDLKPPNARSVREAVFAKLKARGR